MRIKTSQYDAVDDRIDVDQVLRGGNGGPPLMRVKTAVSPRPSAAQARRSEIDGTPRSATARAVSEVEVEILTLAEFLDEIANSPQAAREFIGCLRQRLREADLSSTMRR
jgi:CRP-like cAMP-binding protein